jgi:uncharacterized protein YndB with AHSA1/START domain
MKGNKVIIERVFNAPVKLVWSIWTEPEFIKLWFGSDPDGTVLSADVDLSVGGKYKIAFQDSNGSLHTAFGEYVEIIKFSKLHYTWEWESEAGYVSEVIVEFMAQGEKTLSKLTHSNLNPNSIHGYKDGWNGAMDKIVKKIIENKKQQASAGTRD